MRPSRAGKKLTFPAARRLLAAAEFLLGKVKGEK
jgi:hypothetical protein